ncbi:MAG: hypothetical protein ACTSQO_12845 [Candidatus Helarchaeota archaeon]
MNDLCDYIENLLNILELNEKGLSNLLNLLIQSNKEYTLKEIAELLIFSEKKTYRLVNKLEKLKLIKKSGFPMKISINPNYNDVFINIINEFIKKSKNEIYKKQELLNNLVEIIQKTPLETKIPNELELMKTKNDWTLYIPQKPGIIRACTGKFHLNPTLIRAHNLFDYLPPKIIDFNFKKLLNKKIRFLYNKDILIKNINYFKNKLAEHKRIIDFFKKYRNSIKDFKTRYTDEIITHDFAIIDDSFIFFSIYDPVKPIVIGAKKITNKNIIMLYATKYDDLWKRSHPIEEILDKFDLDNETYQSLKIVLLL